MTLSLYDQRSVFWFFRVCLSCRSTFWFILGIVVWLMRTGSLIWLQMHQQTLSALSESFNSRTGCFACPGNYRGFARERGLIICSYYIENESGTVLSARNFFVFWEIANKMTFCYRGCGQTFPPVRGRLEYVEEMIRQKDIRVMAVNVPTTWIILVWVSLTAGCLQPLTICCWYAGRSCQKGLWTTSGTPETRIEKARKDGKYKGRKPNQARMMQLSGW